MQAVILAGGKGTRLKPFTTNFPKPLVPIGDMPILEVIIKQLRYYGFIDITLAVNHLAELIIAFFGDGEKFGVNISYSMEDRELGTASPLALIQNLNDNFLVMNGDILTTINYADLFDYHISNANEITVSTFKKEVKIDLGVLKTDGDEFIDYIEKPVYMFDVSMGIYIFKKSVIDLVESDRKMDMPELVLKAHQSKKKIRCYKKEYDWLDIGRLDDYDTAQKVFDDRRGEFMPNE